nr:hypothetical protein [Tanacetum cinerariifolium]
MTNKINTVLKATTNRIVRALPSDTVKNPKLNINSKTLVLAARSYPTEDPQCSTHIHGSINTITIHPKQQSNSRDSKAEEEEQRREGTPKTPTTLHTMKNKEDPDRSELSREGHDLLSSRIILSEDDYDRGCRKPSDLEDEFYRDTIKLEPEYLTRMDDEGEVT